LFQALNDKKEKAVPGKLANAEKFSRREAESLVSYYRLLLRSTRQIQYKEYAEANRNVLQLLREEYRLE
jgi:hypothetical protein